MRRRLALLTAFAALLACGVQLRGVDAGDATELRWWKGNTHTHTLWSDGDSAPELVVGWYREQGYDFLVLSDHNALLRDERWQPVDDEGHLTTQRLTDLEAELGPGWVVTREGANGGLEMRLKTLEELRGRFEVPEEFLLIEGEEISATFDETPIHVNGLNLAERIEPRLGSTLLETLQANVDAVREQGERLGRPVLAHLNHPNYQWALTVEQVARVRSDRFFEVYNGHPWVANDGDAEHPSTERMWDIALTLRLGELELGLLYGLAVDDAHAFYENPRKLATPGRGWIHVRAASLDAEHVIEAMRRGDFYASSGVVLRDVRRDGSTLEVEHVPEPGVVHTTTFVGTRRTGDGLGEVGGVLLETTDNPAVYAFQGDELYVRAKVVSSRPHPEPFEEGDRLAAWVQPVVPGRSRSD